MTIGSIRFTSWNAVNVPIRPPSPYAAKSQPTTFASP